MYIFVKSIILLGLFFAPEFRLDWIKKDDFSNLKASLSGYETDLNSCLSSGLTVRLRYEFELCTKKRLWFDNCDKAKIAVSAIEFDPISETYAATTDLLGDSDLPSVERFNSGNKAIEYIVNRSDISYEWLSGGEYSEKNGNQRSVIRSKVKADCKGEYSESMQRLSYILSFGLVSPAGYDSGWVEFSP